MPFPKNELFVHSHSVGLCSENRGLFFEENWNFKVKAVRQYFFFALALLIIFIIALLLNNQMTCLYIYIW